MQSMSTTHVRVVKTVGTRITPVHVFGDHCRTAPIKFRTVDSPCPKVVQSMHVVYSWNIALDLFVYTCILFS